MTDDLLTRARAGDGEAFGLLAGFEGRASVRTWLYRVATSRCLDALRASRRRVPAQAAVPDPAMAHLQVPEPTGTGQVLWLEPYPDALLDAIADSAPGPESRYELTESVSLAFITALQLLSPRQRAALILRDVLGFRAREAAQILNTTEESVTSALKHARSAVQPQRRGDADRPPPPAPQSADERRLVDRLAEAFATADIDAILDLLTDDVQLTMPPLPLTYHGPDLAGRFLRATAFRPGCTATLLHTRANRQPAFGFYIRDPHLGKTVTVGLLAICLSGNQISAITRFDKTVLPPFGLPTALTR